MPVESHVFGPVPSRRLGRSLGVDLVPFKTCTYDCIYCQLGRTTNKTVQRKEYVPTREVLDEIKRKLDEGVKPDYVTLSGSGEPTLHSRLGEIVHGIKSLTDVPLAVLTNGSLLHRPGIIEELSHADLVVPSLDAGDEKLFQYVNRPYESISFEQMLRGLEQLREGFKGKVWLEVFLLGGVTGVEAEVLKIKQIADRVRPDRLQLNTAVRPTAEEFAYAVPQEEMTRLCRLLGKNAEVIADYRGVHKAPQFSALREDVFAMLRRRPCTVSDISASLGLHVNEVTKYVGELEREGRIVVEKRRGDSYYRAVMNAHQTGG